MTELDLIKVANGLTPDPRSVLGHECRVLVPTGFPISLLRSATNWPVEDNRYFEVVFFKQRTGDNRYFWTFSHVSENKHLLEPGVIPTVTVPTTCEGGPYDGETVNVRLTVVDSGEFFFYDQANGARKGLYKITHYAVNGQTGTHGARATFVRYID